MKRITRAILLCFLMTSQSVIANKLSGLQRIISHLKDSSYATSNNSMNLSILPSDKILEKCMNVMILEHNNIKNGRAGSFNRAVVTPLLSVSEEKLEEIYVKLVEQK